MSWAIGHISAQAKAGRAKWPDMFLGPSYKAGIAILSMHTVVNDEDNRSKALPPHVRLCLEN